MPSVGVSALTLVPGVVGGSETYLRQLVRGLATVPGLNLRVLAPRIASDIEPLDRTRIVSGYRASTSTPGRLTAMALALVRGGRLRDEMGLESLDVLHFPLTTVIPRVTSLPIVTSVLDVQHEYLPQNFSRAERAYRRLFYDRSAQSSDRVITISHHAAAAISDRLGVPDERIRVIHLGADLTRFKPSTAERAPFLLYPANRWPHKNHERLLAALRIIRRIHPEMRLVLTGSGHGGHPAEEGVETLGRVSDDELAALYQRAACLVYPSLYEGFGMPLVEAMASGCPVAASNATSIPEVTGDAAILFDPTSPEAIADAVVRVLADPAPLMRRGLERANLFTWERCAEAHAAVYREVAE